MRASSLGGEKYIQELVTTAHPHRCQEVFCMPLETFLGMGKWLAQYILLKESCKYFSVKQKLAMFYILWEKEHLIERFKKNSDILVTPFLTYSMKSSAFCYIYVNLSIKDNALHPQIVEDRKYFPYFQDCLDVLDSIHIPAHVPVIDGAVYQNKKGILLQNVLGICTIDIQFCPDETD